MIVSLFFSFSLLWIFPSPFLIGNLVLHLLWGNDSSSMGRKMLRQLHNIVLGRENLSSVHIPGLLFPIRSSLWREPNPLFDFWSCLLLFLPVFPPVISDSDFHQNVTCYSVNSRVCCVSGMARRVSELHWEPSCGSKGRPNTEIWSFLKEWSNP